MVFFNYSTMQMVAKIVYYGPGLCGKTSNLQYIYAQTGPGSRGEMVSLETESDRTLFFDLLPLDVGSIQGFDTRIQLYTVPGQVFYNTTRKLVLKAVDGVVFVADSQRPMLQANIESLRNLETNLTEVGVRLDEIPLVLQFNKRDLPEICGTDELNQALNHRDWPFFEASAVTGRGVFETLRAVSKSTLLALRKRLVDHQRSSQPMATTRAKPAPSTNSPSVSELQTTHATPAEPAPPGPPPAAAVILSAPSAPPDDVSSPGSLSRPVDILAELEKIRRKARARTLAESDAEPPFKPREQPVANGRSEISKELRYELPNNALERARAVRFELVLEDDSKRDIHRLGDRIVLADAGDIAELLLRLQIELQSSDPS